MSQDDQSKGKPRIPFVEVTHAEFAEICNVTSQKDIDFALACGHNRVKTQGDSGDWFICYPATKKVFRVRFIKPAKSRRQVSVLATALSGLSIRRR